MSDLLKMTPAEFCDTTNACEEGRRFAGTQPSMADVWDNCPRADWLVWVVEKLGQRLDERQLRFFAIWCARNTPMGDGRKTGNLLTDPRSLAALEVAERFAEGKSTPNELDVAWNAAWSASREAFHSRASVARLSAAAAARAAAAAAARDAAWDTAWAAARAACSAGKDAAEAVEDASAQAAAWAAQAVHFRTLVPNPFRKEAQP